MISPRKAALVLMEVAFIGTAPSTTSGAAKSATSVGEHKYRNWSKSSYSLQHASQMANQGSTVQLVLPKKVRPLSLENPLNLKQFT